MSLYEKNDVLQLILGEIPFLVAYIDEHMVYRYASPPYQKWFNLAPADIVGKKVSKVIGEETFQKVKPHIDKALSGTKSSFEIDFKYSDQETRHLYVQYLPTDLTGDQRGTVALIEDLSQQVEKRKQLEESEARLRYALEATGEGVWDWVLADNSVKHNKQWCDLLGLNDGFLEHPLEAFAERIHPLDKDAVMERLQYCLEGQGIYESEHRMRRTDESYIWVRDVGNVVERDDKGAPLRMVGSFKDITDIRETQEKLIQSSKFASLGEMAGGIAHEINNPLAILMGKFSQLKRLVESDRFDSKHFTRELDKTINTTERIAKIVNGMRTFSRESEEDPTEFIDIRKIVEDTLSLCTERMKHSDISFKMKELENDMTLDCRPTQISQILMNLINNSFDAITELHLNDKWISLEVTATESTIEIRVTDCGKGIDDSTIQQMMMPFFTTKPINKGTGLGLSISKKIAENHGGSLRYDPSNPNTSFVLNLPRRQMDKKAG